MLKKTIFFTAICFGLTFVLVKIRRQGSIWFFPAMILQSISFFSDITISPISNLLEDEKEVAIKDSETILNLF